MKIRQQTGFTLVEVLLILAMIGILMGLFVLDYTTDIKNFRLKEATTQLYSDLKKVRIDAMTRSSSVNSRGYGFNFINATSYRFFEFDDVIEDAVAFPLDAFHYGNGSALDRTTETKNPVTITVPNNVQVRIASGTLTNPLFYDRRGWLRNANWATTGGGTFILELPGVTVPRCIVLSTSQIRQGRWEGGVCE